METSLMLRLLAFWKILPYVLQAFAITVLNIPQLIMDYQLCVPIHVYKYLRKEQSFKRNQIVKTVSTGEKVLKAS